MKRWVVVQTNVGREKWAAENMTRINIITPENFVVPYIPMVHEVRLMGRGKAKIEVMRAKALIPGYLFAQIEDKWRFLLGTYGVTSVVIAGGLPVYLPDTELARIKQLEQDGFVMLPPPPRTSEFKEGEKLRVKDGTYVGLEVLHSGMTADEREEVFLNMLGRMVRLPIEADKLERVA